jgi:hypothetical protein
MNGIKNLCIKLYLEVKELFKSEDITRIPPGETELDYIPRPVRKMKAKRKASKKIKQNENI